MASDPSVAAGQSIAQALAQGDAGAALTFPDVSPPGPAPSVAIPASQASSTGIGLFRYPLDTPMYYTSLGINKYSRKDWRSVGTMTITDSIVLPVPQMMVDTAQVEFNEVPIGLVGAGVLGFNQAVKTLTLGDIAKSVGGAAVSVLAQNAEAASQAALGPVGGAAARGFRDGVLAAAGMAINDFMTIMLKGPTYKTHVFNWKFSPRSAAESEQVRLIIQLLKDSQAPGLSPTFGAAFFSWPKVFLIKFAYLTGDRDLPSLTFKVKPSVLLECTTNFTPMGLPAFYAGTSAPESVELRCVFSELEYWLAGDYFNNDPYGRANP